MFDVLFDECTYGIRFKVYSSTASVRFQGCSKCLVKFSGKTIQIQFQPHYSISIIIIIIYSLIILLFYLLYYIYSQY